MKHLIISIFTFLISSSILAQTNYAKGFEKGYKRGYCHDQGIGCIDPVPPVTPIPKIDESASNYNHGYYRGFAMGLEVQKANSQSSSIVNRTRFKTSSPEFIDGIYEPNYNLQFEIASNITKGLSEASNELKEGRFDNTIFISNKILAIIPEQLMANQLICMAYLGKYEKSKNYEFLKTSYSYAQKVFKLNNSNYLLTTIKSKMDNHSNSKTEVYDGNEYLNNLIHKGYEDYNNGDFASAISNYSKYLKVKTNDTDVIFYRALAKSEIGDNYGAIMDYDRILITRKEHPLKQNKISTIFNNKAYSLVSLEKYEEALTNVEIALSIEKDDWFIWDTRVDEPVKVNHVCRMKVSIAN